LTVNGVRSGSSGARINRLGKPRRIKKLGLNACADQFERKLYYSGLEIGVLGSKDGKRIEVYSIKVSSNQWLISPGLRVGADRKTVLEKFGKPVSDDGKTILYVTNDNLGLVSFEFRNDRLVRAEMTETLC